MYINSLTQTNPGVGSIFETVSTSVPITLAENDIISVVYSTIYSSAASDSNSTIIKTSLPSGSLSPLDVPGTILSILKL